VSLNATLIGQAIWFLIFIWITMKFVWPPLERAITTRQKEIADGLDAAERAKKDLDLAGRRAGDIVRDAKTASAETVAQAEKRAQQLIEEAKESARLEYEKIVARAQIEFEQEVERAKQHLRERLSELAVAGAEKILQKEVNPAVHAEMLNELKREL